jgi:hypothetical protein
MIPVGGSAQSADVADWFSPFDSAQGDVPNSHNQRLTCRLG